MANIVDPDTDIADKEELSECLPMMNTITFSLMKTVASTGFMDILSTKTIRLKKHNNSSIL